MARLRVSVALAGALACTSPGTPVTTSPSEEVKRAREQLPRDPEAAERLLADQLKQIERDSGTDSPALAMTHLLLAEIAEERGRPLESAEHVRWALEAFERAFGPDDTRTAFTRVGHASSLSELGRFGEARSALEQAESALAVQLDPRDPRLASVRVQLAFALASTGDHAGAHLRAEDALSTLQELYGVGDIRTAEALQAVGAAAGAARDFAAAESSLAAALAIFQAQPARSEDELLTRVNLSFELIAQGKLEKAEAVVAPALTPPQRGSPATHKTLSGALRAMGRIRRRQERYGDAVLYLRRGLELEEARYGPDSLRLSNFLRELGSVYVDEGRSAQARVEWERYVALLERELGPDHPDLEVGFVSLGEVARREQRFTAEIALLQKALAFAERRRDEHDSLLLRAQIAGARLALGDSETAAAELAQVVDTYARESRPPDDVLLRALGDLVRLSEKAGRDADADRYAALLLRAFEARRGPADPATLQLREIVCGRLALGRRGAEARECFEKAGRADLARLTYVMDAQAIVSEYTARHERPPPHRASEIAGLVSKGLEGEVAAKGATRRAVAVAVELVDSLPGRGAAESIFRRVVELEEGPGGSDPTALAQALNSLAFGLVTEKRHADAIPFYERALAGRRRIGGAPDLLLGHILGGLAQCESVVESLEPALRHAREAEAVYSQVLGEDDLWVAGQIFIQGSALARMGDPREAEPLLARSLFLQERALGPLHPDTRQTRAFHAQVAAAAAAAP